VGLKPPEGVRDSQVLEEGRDQAGNVLEREVLQATPGVLQVVLQREVDGRGGE